MWIIRQCAVLCFHATTKPLMRVNNIKRGYAGSFVRRVYKCSVFVFKTQRSKIRLCILRNGDDFIWSRTACYPWLSFFLFRKAHSCRRKKNNRVISVSNKETVAADIYPAELNADHKFNFAEQTPPCFTVCTVCLLLH